MVNIRTVELPKNKYPIKCPYEMKPTRIVIHNTDNDAPAKNEISYMQSNNNQVSFHFAVDDTEIVQGLPLDRNSWNAGDGATGKGNREGISIEICYSKSGGEKFNKALENSVDLVVYLLRKYGWGIDKVTKHQDYNGKHCPDRILNTIGWNGYINKIKEKMSMNKPILQVRTAEAPKKVRFSWGKVDGADHYDVRIWDGKGKLITDQRNIKTLEYLTLIYETDFSATVSAVAKDGTYTVSDKIKFGIEFSANIIAK